MGKSIRHFLFLGFVLVSVASASAQCLSISIGSTQPVSCFSGNDGRITLNITSSSAQATSPWDIELYYRDSGGGLTQLAFHDNVSVTSITFMAGNGSLNSAGADAFGIVSNESDPGSEYRIIVTASGTGTFTCRTKQINGITIAEPDELLGSVASITPACTPGSGAIAINVSGGSPSYIYTWTGPTPILNTVEDPTGLNAGTYSVTIGDGLGCSVPITGIVVPPPPDATISAAGPFCETGAAVQLTAVTPGGTWSGTGVSPTGMFDPVAAGVGTHTITYSISSGPCPTSDTEDFVVAPAPDPTITPAGPFCSTGIAVTLTAASPGGNWSGTGITSATLGTFNPATAGMGSHTITYTITGTCTVSDTETIVVQAPATVTITPAGPLCVSGSVINLVASVAGGTWTGTGITDATLGTFNPATATAGSHIITYTLPDGCSSFDTETIIVQNPTVVAINAAGPFCSTGGTVNLTATVPGGTWSGTGVSAAGVFDPTVGAGSYTITYTLSDACASFDTENFIVVAPADPTITPAGPFCVTSPATNLIAASPGGTWTGTGITNAAAGTFDPTTVPAGSYVVTYTITGTCTVSDTETIVVQAPAVAVINAAGPLCANGPLLTLTATPAGGTWSGTGITNTATGDFNPSVSGAGTFVITYTVGVGACNSVDTESIQVNAAPTATISGTTSICSGQTAALTVTFTGTAPLSFDYFDGSSINTVTTSANPFTLNVAPTSPTTTTITYTVTSVSDATCSGTTSGSADVTINTPVLTLPATTVCENGGTIFLTGIVTATPSGGTFNFSGTGIIDPATGEFDPAGLSGPISIQVDYTEACAAPTGTLNLTVSNSAAMIVPISPVQVCQGTPTFDLNPYVSGTPATDLIFTGGPGVNTATDQFNPAGLSGLQTVTVDYVGTCAAPQVSFQIDVITTPTLNVLTTTTCENGASIPLTSRVIVSPSGGSFLFSGHPGVSGTTFDPSGIVGPTTVNINVTYTLSGCAVVNDIIPISILDPADPACSGGDCATVVIATVTTADPCLNPAPEGTVTFNINPAFPAVNIIGVRITINGPVSDTHTNDPFFTDLYAGMYTYEIVYGDLSNPACTKTGVFQIPTSGNVGTPAATVQTVPFCATDSTGTVLINVPERPFGDNLEWSLDGITWLPFQNGSIVSGVPAGLAPSFDRVLSVRKDASDVCFAGVTVNIQSTNPPIIFSATDFSTTPSGCTTNDGTLIVNNLPTGGGGGPYRYLMDGTLFPTLPASNTFTGLASGPHVFTIIDNLSCSLAIPFTITFPGFISTSNLSIDDADCASLGTNGEIRFTIDNPGAYEYAITTDITFIPGVTDYIPLAGLNVVIPDLSGGTYYVWVRSGAAACPTRLAPITVGGVQAVSFNSSSENEACFGDGGQVTLTNVTGASNIDYTYELTGGTTGTILFPASLSPFVISNLPVDDYQIRLVQDQSGCTVQSAFQTFNITGPTSALDTLSVSKQLSFPEQPSGALTIKIDNSGENPYEVWIVNVAEDFASDTLLITTPSPVDYEAAFTSLPKGDYTIHIKDQLGCEIQRDYTLPFDHNIYIPNIFTPNGDESNPNFYVRNLPASGSQLIVSDRWGKEVYSSSNYNPDSLWDGGKTPDGVYFYRLKIKGGKTYTGWVEILRGSKP